MESLKLKKVISPNKDKGNGYTNVKLKKSAKLPEDVRSKKTSSNEKPGGLKY